MADVSSIAFLLVYRLYSAPGTNIYPLSYIYWFIGAISNNSRKLAIIAGFYKAIQSAGAAVIYRVDALKAPYMSIFASTWGLLAGGLLIATPVVGLRSATRQISRMI